MLGGKDCPLWRPFVPILALWASPGNGRNQVHLIAVLKRLHWVRRAAVNHQQRRFLVRPDRQGAQEIRQRTDGWQSRPTFARWPLGSNGLRATNERLRVAVRSIVVDPVSVAISQS